MNIALKRQQVAQTVLDNYIFQPLELGKTDCGTLACSVLDAFGIENPLKTSSQTYKSVRGAVRFLKSLGGDLAEIVEATGVERIAPASALPSDLIAFSADEGQIGGWSLGVVVGSNKLIAFVQHEGRVFADVANLTEACVFAAANGQEVRAWRVA